MRKDEFTLLNSLYNGAMGRAATLSDIYRKQTASTPGLLASLTERGYVSPESGQLTAKALKALEPYRVDNAVILAAGASTRFIPLSLEQPKGLF